MNAPPSIRRMAWSLILAAIGLALLVSSVRLRNPAIASDDPPPAEESIGEGLICFGTADLEEGVTSLTPLQPGRVAEILVHENETVKKGTELIRMEDGSSRGRLAEAEASVTLSREQLDHARKLPEKQREQAARQEKVLEAASTRLALARQLLAQRQKMSQPAALAAVDVAASELQVREAEALERVETLRLAELKAETFEAEIRRAEGELTVAEARRDQAKLALEECRLRAPRAGTMLRVNVSPGDVLGTGGSLPALLFAADSPQVIRATVEQEFASRVREGMPARVEDETESSRVWRGKVERVAGWFSQRRTILHDPSQLTDVRTLEFVVVLDAGQPPIRLGQSVRVILGHVPR